MRMMQPRMEFVLSTLLAPVLSWMLSLNRYVNSRFESSQVAFKALTNKKAELPQR